MKQNIQRFGLPVLSLALLCSCGGDAPSSSREKAAAEGDFYTVDPAQAATISGKVVYKGEVPPAEEIDMSRNRNVRRCIRDRSCHSDFWLTRPAVWPMPFFQSKPTSRA